MMEVTMTKKPGPKKVQSEGRSTDMPRTPASPPAGHSEPWVLGFTSFLKRMPLVARSLDLLSGGDRSKGVKMARMPTPEELTKVAEKMEKEVFCDVKLEKEKEVFYDALEVHEEEFYDAQESLDEPKLPSSSRGQGRRVTLKYVPSLSDFIDSIPQDGAPEILATNDISKKAKLQGEPARVRAALLKRKKKELKNMNKSMDDVLKQLVRLEKKNAKVCRKNKRVMDKVVQKRVQIMLPFLGERRDDVKETKATVVEEKEVPDNDGTVMAKEKEVPDNDGTVMAEEKEVPGNDRIVMAEEKEVPDNDGSVMAEEKEVPDNDRTVMAEEKEVPDNDGSVMAETASTESACSADAVSCLSTFSCEKDSEDKAVEWEVDTVGDKDKDESGAANAASPMTDMTDASDGLSHLNITSYMMDSEEEKDYVVSDIAWDSDVDVADDKSWSMETASTRSLCSLDAISYMSTASSADQERTALTDAASMLSVDTYVTAHSSDLAVAMETAAVNDKQQVELELLEETLKKGGNMAATDVAAQDGAKKHGKYCRVKRWVRAKLSKGWRRLTHRGRAG
ncbi:E2-like enzyme [Branchiostoma belcheri]|nr:E2-like enzyme [Branchiostoma belcheri]